MIECTAAGISNAIRSDLEFLRAMLRQFDELFDLIKPGPVRDSLIRNNAKLRLRLAELPMRVAARSPFENPAELLACAQDEVRAVLVAVTEAELFLNAQCGGDSDG
jgi:hypothetical protein